MFGKGKPKGKATAAAAPVEPTNTMPPKKELEKLYLQLLEELAIPEAKREQMVKTEDDERKWKLIQAHTSKLEHDSHNKQGASSDPSYWVAIIDAKNAKAEPSLTLSKARELESVLRLAHKQFLTDFISESGVRSLLNVTAWYSERFPKTPDEKKIVYHLMECYKNLMNNHVGMQGILEIEGSITTLALSMDFTDLKDLSVAREVVLLLGATCFYSSKGRNLVVNAMDECRKKWRESCRFETLVKAFKKCTDNEFRAAAIVFITTIVNSAASLDSRVKVRNDFLALDIMEILRVVSLQSKIEDETSITINTQYQVFEDMMVADHAEVVHNMLERRDGVGDDEGTVILSDQQAVFRAIRESAMTSGCSEQLLELTQLLLLIPTERSFGLPLWKGITQFVREATNIVTQGGAASAADEKKKDKDKTPKLNYQILHALIEERLKLDKQLSKIEDSEDIILKQRKQIEDMNKELNDPKRTTTAQATKMQEEIDLLRAKSKDMLAEVAALKKANFVLQNELREAQSQSAEMRKKLDDALLKAHELEEKLEEAMKKPASRPSLTKALSASITAAAPALGAMLSSRLGSSSEPKSAPAAAVAIPNSPAQPTQPNGALPPLPTATPLKSPAAPAQAVSSPAAETPSKPAGNVDPKYAKYHRMKHAGLPEGAILNAMQRDGVQCPPNFFGDGGGDDQSSTSTAASAPSAPEPAKDNSANDPKYAKYYRMKHAGLPEGAIVNAMQRDNIECPPNFFGEGSSFNPPPKVSVKDDPKYVKYYRMKKSGLPEGAILNAMVRDGVMCPPDFFDDEQIASQARKTMAVGNKGGLPLPGKQQDSHPQDEEHAKMPAKKQKQPNLPMRGIFWTKLPPNMLEGTIWPELNDEVIKLDIPTLEAKYSKPPEKTASKSGKPGEKMGPAKPERVHIVDGKRQQNVGIIISRLHSTPQEVKKSIMRIDDTILSLERSKALLGIAPTDDEITMFKGYTGDIALLTDEDQFLMEMISVPRLEQRLKAVVLRHTFDKETSEVKSKLKAVRDACEEIDKSTELRRLLEIILAIGNYINGGTPRGGAYGFKLDALGKLETIHENEGRHSLVHYIVKVAQMYYPDLLHFSLPCCEAACTLTMADINKDISAISQNMRLLKKELDAEHPDKEDRFVKVFGTFELKGTRLLSEIEADYHKILEEFQKLVEKFGEKGKMEPDAFFTMFVNFEVQFKAAIKMLSAEKEKEEKAKKLEEQKEHLAKLRMARQATAAENGSSGGGGVIDEFQKANQGDASQIVETLRARFRNQGTQVGSSMLANDNASSSPGDELKKAMAKRRGKQ